jgi:hypothetical protein
MLRNTKKVCLTLVIIIIIILCYYFLPRTFKVSNGNKISAIVEKDIDGLPHNYSLNEQEVHDLTKILEKSKFRHGVSRPNLTFADKSISVIVNGGGLNPIIKIYYDDDKVFVYANISNRFYRISNKEEIKNYIENIVNTNTTEFKEY